MAALLYGGDGRKPVRVAHLCRLQGLANQALARALPGDNCAIARMDGLQVDTVLHAVAADDHIHPAPPPLPEPVQTPSHPQTFYANRSHLR